MAELLATTLDTEYRRTVNPKILLRFVGRSSGETLDPDRAREVAAHFGAG